MLYRHIGSNVSEEIPSVGNIRISKTIRSIIKQQLGIYEIVTVRNGFECPKTIVRQFLVHNKVFICEIKTNVIDKSNALNVGIVNSRFD